MNVAIIIPAFNEAERLPEVLRVLAGCRDLWQELVVVDDGSRDGTAAAARACGVGEVLELPANRGKGAALRAGALAVRSEVLCFLDADLRGLTRQHLEGLLRPVQAGEADMALGLFRSGRRFTDLSHRVAPWVSGQRALLRSSFLGTPDVGESRLGVEALLTHEARERGWRVRHVYWQGVTHVTKEEKLGLARGFLARLKMYAEVLRSLWGRRGAPVRSGAAAPRAAAAPEK